MLATEAHAICKQTVHILLECFPIIFSILIQRFVVNNVVIRSLREHEKKNRKEKTGKFSCYKNYVGIFRV